MKAAKRDHWGNVEGFHTKRLGFVKGQWYWERQIGSIVVMWLHDGAHKPQSRWGLRIGPLYMWKDKDYRWNKRRDRA